MAAPPKNSLLISPSDISVIDYSERSIAVIGDTKIIKDKLKELGGRYNPNLTVDDKKVKGWIFSKKKEPLVHKLLEGDFEAISPPVSPISFPNSALNISIINYSEKSIAVIGDTKMIKDKLKELGGRYNPNLTVDDKKVKGWIFSKKKEPLVRELLE